MVINSSNVTMSSARNYHSGQFSGGGFVISGSGNRSMAENLVQVRSEESQGSRFMKSLKSQLIDDSTADMEQSMLGMRSSSFSISSMSIGSSSYNQREVQENVLLYLLRNLRSLLQQGRQNHVSRQQEMQSSTLRNQSGTQTGDIQLLNGSSQIGTFYSYQGYYEEEATAFQTTGKVVTADGREIEFGIDVRMSRSFEEYMMQQNEVYMQQPYDLVDPLVINLQSDIATVSDQKFLFDLDGDGKEEEISQLHSGSGFLALDKNEDGMINDGTELFGTSSGDGFKDLAVYDKDGNGWIDEQDDIYDKLRIWTKDEDGKDVLYTLKEAGVGAICLQRASTDFSLNSLSDNRTNAKIRETGIFLYENGSVGTMQHLDLAT